jgi:uncharacterized membrane protein YgdD (TMEM256/DUF423 family)
MHRIWIALGSLAGLSGVAMAAYAAHGLPGRLAPEALEMVRSGVQMQLWHALALVLCGVWAAGRGGALADWAAAAFVLGILCFCGAVYALGLGGVQVASLAPVGGVLLMAGWALLGLSALWPAR